MVSVEPGSLVLVTGVNGHLAGCIALRLLQKGYRVRGTVRALKSGKYVTNEFNKLGVGEGFSLVEVPDISAPNAFAEAVKGVDAVAHVASPVTMDAKRPEEQYVPAVDGSVNLLKTIVEHGPAVKKVVLMGSIGSVIMTAKDPHKEIITSNDWNIMTDELVKNLDDPLIGFHIYVGSKLAAERAAWKFVEEQKPAFSLTSVLPAVALGPIHKAMTGPPRLDVSLGWLYDYIADPPRKDGAPTNPISTFVHSYDVADLFVASLTSPEADGQRLIALGERTSWAKAVEFLRKAYPERKIPPADPNAQSLGFPGAEVIQWDLTLPTKLLGGKWRSLEQLVLDGAKDLLEKEQRGWDKPE